MKRYRICKILVTVRDFLHVFRCSMWCFTSLVIVHFVIMHALAIWNRKLNVFLVEFFDCFLVMLVWLVFMWCVFDFHLCFARDWCMQTSMKPPNFLLWFSKNETKTAQHTYDVRITPHIKSANLIYLDERLSLSLSSHHQTHNSFLQISQHLRSKTIITQKNRRRWWQ